MLIIFLLVALPIIKIWAIVLIYRIVAALVEPISDKRIAEVVGSMAGSSLWSWCHWLLLR